MSENMKDSGIEWIGKIPIDWSLKRIQFCLDEINRKNNPVQTHQILSLTKEKGVMLYEEKGDIGNKSKNDITEYHLAYPNTIVLNCMNILIGSVGISNYFGCVSPVYYVFKQKEKNDLRYINYIFSSSAFQKELRKYANGILEIRLRVSAYDIFKRKIPTPSLEEQTRIANFLDSKCTKIDELKETIQKQIELLQERKQSVITHAVTKGLDPNVPMKDSGVEWIGEIPENWKIVRIKSLINNDSEGIKIGPFGSALTGKVISDGEYNVYSQANLISGDFSFTKNTVTKDTYKKLSAYEVIPGDICLSMMGTIGKCRIVPESIKKGIMDSHLIKIRLQNNIDCRFFMYVYDKDLSGICYIQMQYDKKGSIMDGLNTKIVKNLYVPFPPIENQKEIVKYLDKQCSKIDALIAIKKQQLEKLEEYKKSIIYEYVTGKKRVM